MRAALWGTTALGDDGGGSMSGGGSRVVVVSGSVRGRGGDSGAVMASAYEERSMGAGSTATCMASTSFLGSPSCSVLSSDVCHLFHSCLHL